MNKNENKLALAILRSKGNVRNKLLSIGQVQATTVRCLGPTAKNNATD